MDTTLIDKRGKSIKILFLMQVPPPVTGASLRNSEIFEIIDSSAEYYAKLIPFNFAKNVSLLSGFSILKVLKAFRISARMIYDLVFFRPQIVYMTPVPHGFAYYRDIINILIAKMFRKKMVFHLRPLGFKAQSERNKFYRTINKILFKNTYVICLSKIVSFDIEGIYNGECIILNNGIKAVKFEKEKSKNSEPVIMFYSNLFFAKGIVDFLELLSILKQEGVKFRGQIYGQEGDISVDDLNNLINRFGLSVDVSYHGKVNGNEKYKILYSSDIFVFPTHNENFPGVILEAMQASVPVVSVYEGSIPEIVVDGETGFLKEKGDNEGLAERVKFLIENPEIREKMGRKGRERFLNFYTHEKFERNISKIFRSIVNSKKLY